jgi:Domain of unknown function (DUF4157)
MATTSLAASQHFWLQSNDLLEPGADLESVRLHVGGPLTWYLKLVKKSAITLGGHIWFVSEAKRDDIALLAHELVHVAQYREFGSAGFLARYLRDMARAGFRYSRRLPLEAPAYARQARAREVLATVGPPGVERVDR